MMAVCAGPSCLDGDAAQPVPGQIQRRAHARPLALSHACRVRVWGLWRVPQVFGATAVGASVRGLVVERFLGAGLVLKGAGSSVCAPFVATGNVRGESQPPF